MPRNEENLARRSICSCILLGFTAESSSAAHERPYQVRPTARCLAKKGIHVGAEGDPQLAGILIWKTRGRGAIQLFFAETPFGATRYMKVLINDLEIAWHWTKTQARRVLIRRGNVDIETHNSTGRATRPNPSEMAILVACLPPAK